MMRFMIRTPIFLSMLALAVPAAAAPAETSGWSVNAGGALNVASLALKAIKRGDVAAVTDDRQGPSLRMAADPTKLGLRQSGRDDYRVEEPIAGISARFSF